MVVDRNGRLLDLVSSSKFRASLVPAAAVIPAELEMGNIVAVKTYVVTSDFVPRPDGPRQMINPSRLVRDDLRE